MGWYKTDPGVGSCYLFNNTSPFIFQRFEAASLRHSSAGKLEASFSREACAASRCSASEVMFRMVQEALLKMPQATRYLFKNIHFGLPDHCKTPGHNKKKNTHEKDSLQDGSWTTIQHPPELHACNAFSCCKTPSQPPSSIRFRRSDKNLGKP